MSVEGAAGHGSWSVGRPSVPGSELGLAGDAEEEARSALTKARWAAIGFAVGAVFAGPFAPVAWAVIIVNFFRRVTDRGARILLLKQLGVALAAIPSAIFVFFIVGETMTDPGGLRGMALVLLWSMPVTVVATVCWTWPRRATLMIGLLVVGVMLMDSWFAIDVERWKSYEDSRGPVSAVATFVVVAVTVFLAWRRPASGGAFMLAVPMLTLVLATFVHELRPHAISAAVVGLVPGALFVASALLESARQPVAPH